MVNIGIVLLLVSNLMYAAACRSLSEGSNEWFDVMLAQNIDQCPPGTIDLHAAAGMLFMAADKNPGKLDLLAKRYGPHKRALHDAWQSVVCSLIPGKHFDRVKQLITDDPSLLSPYGKRLIREKGSKRWLSLIVEESSDSDPCP